MLRTVAGYPSRAREGHAWDISQNGTADREVVIQSAANLCENGGKAPIRCT